MRALLLLLLLSLITALSACAAKDGVEFRASNCWVGDHTATLQEVELQQTQLSERLQSRQPWFVVVTLLVVVLAGLSHIEKLVLLFSTRTAQSKSLGDRIRLALDRYRAYPIRYFALVTATLVLLAMAGGFYIFLDADKRASERSLAQLQFCHLALRSGDEHRVLDEQRKNLEAIAATAGSIHQLVDRLPPEEQEKAKQIVAEINTVLSKQGRLVGDYLAKTASLEQAAQTHGTVVEKNLGQIESSLTALRALPAGMQDLHNGLTKLDTKIDSKLTAADQRAATIDERLRALELAVKSLRSAPIRTDGGVP